MKITIRTTRRSLSNDNEMETMKVEQSPAIKLEEKPESDVKEDEQLGEETTETNEDVIKPDEAESDNEQTSQKEEKKPTRKGKRKKRSYGKKIGKHSWYHVKMIGGAVSNNDVYFFF